MSCFIIISKKSNAKKYSDYCTTALISQVNKVMLKILQVRLQQKVNRELPAIQAGFRKGRGTREQIANLRWIIEKLREFQKNIYFWFIDYFKPLTVWITTNWKILKEIGIPDHLTSLLRKLYVGQEATVKTHMEQQTGTKLGKESGCILLPCLFNLYSEYSM